MRRFSALTGIALLTLASGLTVRSAGAADDKFVKREGAVLLAHGVPFRFAGTNNYYLPYKSQLMVNDVLATAAAQKFNVLCTWGAIDIGNADGTNSIAGKAEGVYFQYWNGTAPAYNDTANGLSHLDYVIYRAGQLGVRLVIPFVNNWRDFGGMDQYVRWRGGQFHDQFYTDATIRQWYKNWISHVLNRLNPLTGLRYKDDPTIMTWELANEPRCKGSGDYPSSGNCTPSTLTAWADDVSQFITKQDNKHLVSVGDEGFYCVPGSSDWTENCGEGVDAISLARLTKIDVMSYHLYPDGWGKSVEWGTQWIERHIADALAAGKPAMMGEFGLRSVAARNPTYRAWTDTVAATGGAGALYWMLAGKQDDGSLYPDYDGFTVYCPSPVCTLLSNFSVTMATNVTAFPPVADHDAAVTAFNTPIALSPLSNDVGYGSALVPSSLDLDPVAAGRQSTVTTLAGSFVAAADGRVLFTPQAGFVGSAQAAYTITDTAGRVSNAAGLTVTVEPNVNGALLLHSFESGVEGWGPASWDPAAGTTQQSSSYATNGASSLRVDAAYGHWFGVVYGSALDISSKTHLKWDLTTTGAGTSQQLAIQAGSGWSWCEGGGWGWVNGGTSTTMDVDLTTLSCGAADLSQVHAIYIFLGNGGAGSFYLDNVRAE